MSNPRNNKFTTIQPGISISSKYSTNGTLGLIVYDKINDYHPCILSNWHVLAKRSIIPRLSFSIGSPVYQPGKNISNGIKAENIIARLSRYDRLTDSAIARLLVDDLNLEQFETNITINSVRIPKKGDIVEKSGARTGVTKGHIVDTLGSYVKIKPIDIQNPDNIEISKGGDSGSIWYDPVTKEGLVLHSHGEPDDNSNPQAEYAGGFSLIKVMETLRISFTKE